MDKALKNPWFKEGLRFRCTGCGKCCTGSPGYVFLTQTDLETLAAHFQLSSIQFAKKYCRLVNGKYSLLEQPKTYDCIFLKNNQCTVYGARPIQCRTYPWWIENLREPKDWKEAAKHCEGINHPDSPTISPEHIEEQCTASLDSLLQQNFSL